MFFYITDPAQIMSDTEQAAKTADAVPHTHRLAAPNRVQFTGTYPVESPMDPVRVVSSVHGEGEGGSADRFHHHPTSPGEQGIQRHDMSKFKEFIEGG
ncbi:hypothetical protein [Rhodococcus opacus]|uniref:hypothetical protein n=1 Tax=Rhodococcus opacus TaxID=37919 RepID=UPI0018E40C37|nr:hypothetical protein [Rhodococcus opacus]